MVVTIKPNERIDDIGFGHMKLIQDPEEFCYGVDAVILADFAAKAENSPEYICDLGTGTGVIPLILAHKTSCPDIMGIEIRESQAEMAARSASLNDLSDRIRFQTGDVRDFESRDKKFSLVTCNPPYFPSKSSLLSKEEGKSAARHEICGGLEDFISCASRILENKGSLCMIHRPSRLVDIICIARKYGLEPKRLRMVSPSRGKAPNLVLVQMVKNGGRQLDTEDSLYVYEADGHYSREIEDIYERI